MIKKKLKKLPIGIQTFSKIIKQDMLYIDKTAMALDLIKNYDYVFLSRPRRFGKSLFLDTLHNIFEGNQIFFKDLDIYDKWNWDIKYPVIKLDFFGDLRSSKSLKKNILSVLKSNQKRLKVECDNTDDFGNCFKILIENICNKYNRQVVVLIDEYDKAILDNLDQMEVAGENREILKALYSVLKSCDKYLKFVFLTGVSKFSKSSIFSGLNMIEDISLTPRYGNICGYTQNDIETIFLPYFKGTALKRKANFKKIKQWYDGYNFLKDNVYNPFDILLFIKNDFAFKDYWFATGTPTFLIKLIKKRKFFLPDLSNLIVGGKLLDSFDIDNLDLEVILYQAGYLTIDKVLKKRRGGIQYKLRLPNKEVKSALNDYIIDAMISHHTDKIRVQDDLYDGLYDKNLEQIKNSLISMFASIPNDNYRKNMIQNYEGFYASVIYVYLQSLGIDIIGEDVTNKGRIDLTVKINNIIYIMEFKMGSSACRDALDQIKLKNYHQKYQNLNQDIYLIGINFDEKEKNISRFEWEQVYS